MDLVGHDFRSVVGPSSALIVRKSGKASPLLRRPKNEKAKTCFSICVFCSFRGVGYAGQSRRASRGHAGAFRTRNFIKLGCSWVHSGLFLGCSASGLFPPFLPPFLPHCALPCPALPTPSCPLSLPISQSPCSPRELSESQAPPPTGPVTCPGPPTHRSRNVSWPTPTHGSRNVFWPPLTHGSRNVFWAQKTPTFLGNFDRFRGRRLWALQRQN